VTDERQDKQGPENDGADPSSASRDKGAIPEVEAEIVEEERAAPDAALLKETVDPDGEDEAAQADMSVDEDDVSGDAASDAKRAKPRMSGVTIFAVFAAGALAVFAYWLWQGRESGGAAAAVASRFQAVAPAQDNAHDDGVFSTQEPTAAAAAADDDDLTLAPEQKSPEQKGPEQQIPAQAPTRDRAGDPQPDGLSSASEIAATAAPDDESEAGLADGAGAGDVAGTASGDLVPESLAAEASTAENPASENPAFDGAGSEEADPQDLAAEENRAELKAAQADFDAELDAVKEGFARRIEQLTADLVAERERSAALQAEMTAMRASYEETLRAREASAEAALASVRADLDAARRALDMPPEAAGEASAALARLAAAVEAGRSFEPELAAVAAIVANEAALQPLRARAEAGAPTRRELKRRFADAARKALAAADQAAADGMVDSLEARMKSLVSIRPAEPQPGDSPGAVMSRIEDAVRRDAFALALALLSELPAPARAELEDWAALVRAHEEARAALVALNGAVLAQAAR